MRNAIAAFALLAAVFLPVQESFAQNVEPTDAMAEPLVTDRPDFTESTEAVPTGHFQLEVGYTFTYDREGTDRSRSHTVPQTLLRLGIARDFELRLGWDGYDWTRERFETTTRGGRTVTRHDWIGSAADLSLGFKIKLCEQQDWRPHLGILVDATIPTGNKPSSSFDVDPAVRLLWAYDLSDRLAIAGNFNLAVPTQDGHRFVQAQASLSLAVAVTDSLGAYIEYFGLYPNEDTTDAAHTLNGGFTFLINKDLQIDALVGMGLNEEADDFFTGIGVSWRR